MFLTKMTNIVSSNRSGVTLIELLLGTGISAILLTTIVVIQTSMSDSQTTLNNNSKSFNEANIAIQAITREIRNARPASTGAYPLQLADDQQIIFYANIDDDPEPEKIRYFLSGNTLNRGIINPTGEPPSYTDAEKVNLVIPDITNGNTPIFTYYNGDWPKDTDNNPLPSPARLLDTKMVTINLSLNPQSDHPEGEYQLQSSAQIRNLKTNL